MLSLAQKLSPTFYDGRRSKLRLSGLPQCTIWHTLRTPEVLLHDLRSALTAQGHGAAAACAGRDPSHHASVHKRKSRARHHLELYIHFRTWGHCGHCALRIWGLGVEIVLPTQTLKSWQCHTFPFVLAVSRNLCRMHTLSTAPVVRCVFWGANLK